MKRPCNYPGCPTLIERGAYCPTHQATRPDRHKAYNQGRQRDPATALAYKIRKSRKWLLIRSQVLADNPVCADPFGDHARMGVTRSSQQVHHLQGIVEHPHLWNVQTNLQALCTACHAKVERSVREDAKRAPGPSSTRPRPSQTPPGEGEKFSPFG